MAQIGFTKKQEHVYNRFVDLLLKERQRNGRIYAPQFLDAMMDRWEEKTNEPKGMDLLELLETTKKLGGLNEIEIAALDAAIEGCKNNEE
jgi:hypothetical protein